MCSALGVKALLTSPSPSLSLPQSFIHLHGYLPPSCCPQEGWCILPLRACCQPGSALSLQLERRRGGESLLELCFHSVPLLTKAERETRQQSGVLRAAAACTPRARARLRRKKRSLTIPTFSLNKHSLTCSRRNVARTMEHHSREATPTLFPLPMGRSLKGSEAWVIIPAPPLASSVALDK